MSVLLIAGSPSKRSRSAALLNRVKHQLSQRGVLAERVRIRDLSPPALLLADIGHPSVVSAIAQLARARAIMVVTLRAKSFPTDVSGHPLKGLPRHPSIKDEVVISAGSTVLGRVTRRGGSTMGGNVWQTHDAAHGSHSTQARLRDETVASAVLHCPD